jgi:diguanylate cyclase (GGDEF)-like protein
MEHIQEALAYIHEGVHTYANPAYLRLFGYETQGRTGEYPTGSHGAAGIPRRAQKCACAAVSAPAKPVEPVELSGVRSNGQTFPILLECAPTRINDEPCTQIIVRDATPEKTVYNQQLEDLIKFDEITGLYSRRFFVENLELNHDGAVLYLLFTDYSAIRYALGFEAIDRFMVEATGLIKKMLTAQDMAGVFASGVITIFVPANSATEPMALADNLRKAIAEFSFKINGKLFTTTCCIGVCNGHDSHFSAIQILANADRACEAARQKGGNQVEVYEPPKDERSGRAAISEQDEASIRLIRNALTKGRLSLIYQPIVSFENAEEARYKVYLRLLDDSDKPQPMDKLGAVAVRYGLMNTLDKWTLIHSLKTLMEIQQAGATPPALFVRISRNSLHDKEFIDWLSKRIKESRLAGNRIVLEVKEDNADDCFEETRQLRGSLRELGCGLALSHFGGKSHSDRLLKELLPDYIKLDGSLIERMSKAKDEKSRLAMSELTQQAQELKTQVVAAGVSTAPQMASIWQFGVTLVQGNMVAEAGPNLDFDFRQYAG